MGKEVQVFDSSDVIDYFFIYKNLLHKVLFRGI